MSDNQDIKNNQHEDFINFGKCNHRCHKCGHRYHNCRCGNMLSSTISHRPKTCICNLLLKLIIMALIVYIIYTVITNWDKVKNFYPIAF